MPINPSHLSETPDPAAEFAAALSLWRACHARAAREGLNLSELYNGMDQCMREVVRTGRLFEGWSCRHIDFTELEEVWPYLLEDRFGEACLCILSPAAIHGFDEDSCLRVALRMGSPVRVDDDLPVPIDVTAPYPATGPGFAALRIQSIRTTHAGTVCVPYTAQDDPYDARYRAPFFGLYGIGEDGLLEHVADRTTYADALNLARKLAPDIALPEWPCAHGRAKV